MNANKLLKNIGLLCLVMGFFGFMLLIPTLLIAGVHDILFVIISVVFLITSGSYFQQLYSEGSFNDIL